MLDLRVGKRIRFTRDEARQLEELAYAMKRTLATKKPATIDAGNPVAGWQSQVLFQWNQMARVIRRAIERSHDSLTTAGQLLDSDN